MSHVLKVSGIHNITESLATRLSDLEWLLFDFDGVFTDNSVLTDQNGVEAVRCSRFDGIGLSRLTSNGLKTAIVSTERNPVVSARAKKLNIRCYQNIPDKSDWLQDFAQEQNLMLSAFGFVGNDVNDLGAMHLCGVSIAVPDAHPSVIAACDWCCQTAGGYGAVREICDLISDVKERIDDK